MQFPDCCYREQTGEANIKGVITWSPVIADSVDTQKCPYGLYNTQFNTTTFNKASRLCLPNFEVGAQWQTPNTSECAYKTKTTLKLQEISQVGSISYSNISASYVPSALCLVNSITLEPLHLVLVSLYRWYIEELCKASFTCEILNSFCLQHFIDFVMKMLYTSVHVKRECIIKILNRAVAFDFTLLWYLSVKLS